MSTTESRPGRAEVAMVKATRMSMGWMPDWHKLRRGRRKGT